MLNQSLTRITHHVIGHHFFFFRNTRLSPSFFATSDTMSAAKRQKTAFQIDLSAYKSLKINPFTQVRKAPDE